VRRRRPGRAPASLACALLVAACAGGGGAPPASPGPSDPEAITFAPELDVDLAAMQRTPTGLYIQDLEPGTGILAQTTSLVSVRYVGYLPDGTIFDTTGSGEPFTFRMDAREVIRGWSQGIVGMQQGGIRRLVVRPSLGYGSHGRGSVPPNTTLVFDVQLLDVR
jgi:FKBP-type peptidyl-prolyl cis-trans isomerase FkpA